MPATASLWLNGSPQSSSTNQTYNVFNAATQEVVTIAASASSEDAIAAIVSADKVQAEWEAVPWRTKRHIFLQAAQIIQTPQYAKLISDAVTQEISAGEAWGPAEVAGAVLQFTDAASMATMLQGETFPSASNPGGIVTIEKRAFGTVFAISAFNAPVFLTVRAIAVPLLCGNTVVLKSSEMSPLCTEIVVKVLYEAGLPKGVLNLLHVSAENAPRIVAEIIGHKLIRHINFTGSDRVGKIIAGEAAKYLKPCVFELGGKSASVVLNDANVEDTARSIIHGATVHGGQACVSTERVIVQREISEALIKTLTTLAQKVHAGSDKSAHIPPLITSGSAARVVSMLKDAKERGAEVIVGDLTHKGAVLQPHILLGVEPGWPMWDRETFGPVFGIKIVDTEEEAVTLANATDYSLMGAVWTRDIEKGLKIARRIRAGQVSINGSTVDYQPGLDVRGLGGATGYGAFGIEDFTQKRALVISPAGSPYLFANDS
ncbi:aldehyde dehydrogenase [Hysterangium stoloniferum]|nr:aldehyde dehydrogenase [Hysterangium stoloniferum]